MDAGPAVTAPPPVRASLTAGARRHPYGTSALPELTPDLHAPLGTSGERVCGPASSASKQIERSRICFRIDRVNGHKRLCRPTVLFFLVRVLVQSSCNLLRDLRGLCRCDRPPFPGQQLLVMSLERKIVRLESLMVRHSVSSRFPERTRRPDVSSAFKCSGSDLGRRLGGLEYTVTNR